MTEKDLISCKNLIRLLNEKAKYELDTKEVVEMYAAFVWLDGLKTKIEDDLKPKPAPVISNPEPKKPVRKKKAKSVKSK